MTKTHEIAVRAYSQKRPKPPRKPRDGDKTIIKRDTPSKLTLIIDTETTTDASQHLRVGCYQLRDGDELKQTGLFYDEHFLPPEDLAVLQTYAQERNLELITRWKFVHDVFYRFGYEQFATIAGFNLPFDLSRLAISHSASRRAKMRGGYSLVLSKNRRLPRVRVKSLSRRASVFDFATPMGQLTGRGMRNRGMKVQHHGGFFVDVKTIAAALTSRSFSLKSLCDHLKVETPKGEEEHGKPLTNGYLDYLRTDVQATWECFVALKNEYARHGLAQPLHKIISEASVGKAYLRQMGIRSLRENQPDFPRELFGKIMCGYYGGRAEIRWRRTATQVCYCDFKSMYPTVNTLMGLWRYVVADCLKWRDATTEVREFLRTVTADQLRNQGEWQKLTAIVRLRPNDDLVPVRAKYDGEVYTIGLNYLSCDSSLWYTLADLVAAKILTGRTPQIEEAIMFEPGAPQLGLKPIDLFGLPEFRIDPHAGDGFRSMVNLRDSAKRDPMRQTEQQAIKILSNATSYGIFIEVQRDEAPEPETLQLWGPDGEIECEPSKSIEQPGRYFNAALGAQITGAARLMLALAERRTMDEGLDWVFCDTDSLAIARPEGMDEAEFYARADRVIDWFMPLNPYDAGGSILQMEKHNLHPATKARHPLFAWAVSAKRYVLFNIDADGEPILRKASAHGLGHLRAPYQEEGAPSEIPSPIVGLSEIGVERWQYDLWCKVVSAALAGHPDVVALDYHDAFGQPAISRYTANTPKMLDWFDTYNAPPLPYSIQVKPFNFLLSATGKNGAWVDYREELLAVLPGKGRRKSRPDLKPVAAFETDPAKAVFFDRETSEPILREQLMTYAEALASYHLSPESKFENGRPFDRGRTERRHVAASGLKLIGKEANKVGEFGEAEPTGTTCVAYTRTQAP